MYCTVILWAYRNAFSEELSDLFSHLDECRLIRVQIVNEFHSLAVYWWNFISLSFDVLARCSIDSGTCYQVNRMSTQIWHVVG